MENLTQVANRTTYVVGKLNHLVQVVQNVSTVFVPRVARKLMIVTVEKSVQEKESVFKDAQSLETAKMVYSALRDLVLLVACPIKTVPTWKLVTMVSVSTHVMWWTVVRTQPVRWFNTSHFVFVQEDTNAMPFEVVVKQIVAMTMTVPWTRNVSTVDVSTLAQLEILVEEMLSARFKVMNLHVSVPLGSLEMPMILVRSIGMIALPIHVVAMLSARIWSGAINANVILDAQETQPLAAIAPNQRMLVRRNNAAKMQDAGNLIKAKQHVTVPVTFPKEILQLPVNQMLLVANLTKIVPMTKHVFMENVKILAH